MLSTQLATIWLSSSRKLMVEESAGPSTLTPTSPRVRLHGRTQEEQPEIASPRKQTAKDARGARVYRWT